MDADILTTITGLAGATKATVEAIKAFSAKAKGNREAEKAAAEALGLVTDLQARLFQFQEIAIRLREENRELREEIREEKMRRSERERYQGKQLGHSLLMVREDYPDIYYCPTCLETKNAPVTLQPDYDSLHIGPYRYRCNMCKTSYPVPAKLRPRSTKKK